MNSLPKLIKNIQITGFQKNILEGSNNYCQFWSLANLKCNELDTYVYFRKQPFHGLKHGKVIRFSQYIPHPEQFLPTPKKNHHCLS